MKNTSLLLLLITFLTLLFSCKSKPTENSGEIAVPKAAVTTTSPILGKIADQITLNGKTVYLKSNAVVAPISGYLSAVNIKLGDNIQEDAVLFEIETRENKALQQAGSESGLGLGKIKVKATASGMINEPVTLGVGAYVTEGSLLCNLVDVNDLLVAINVPYEFHALAKIGTNCQLFLPDHSQIDGAVFQIRPIIDEASQTQQILIKLKSKRQLPENLNLTATFQKSGSAETLLLPKKAILTNETQTEFWVMKIVQDSVAVIVPIEMGIRNDSLVEIISADFKLSDKIILEGSYGLPDSSVVKMVK
jgi:multidrug efflux pump subunit AcrA (membrane-fusion protein)